MPDASSKSGPDAGDTRTLRWTNADALSQRRRGSNGLDYFRAMVAGDIPHVPVYTVVGMRLTDVDQGYARFECQPGPHLLNPMGGVHGGFYAIVMDSAAGIATQTWVDEGSVAHTLRLTVEFLRPLTAESGPVICEGRTAKVGRQVTLSDATITDSEGRLVGRAQGAFMISPNQGASAVTDDASAPAFEERELTIAWGDPTATSRAAVGKTGRDLLAMLARHELPAPPISKTLGFELKSVSDGEAVFVCEPTERQYNPMGSMHGGLPSTLIDSATGCAIQTQLPAGHSYSTIYLTTEYFRAITVETGPLSCAGRIVKQGRRVAVADAEVTDAKGTVYARGTSTCLAFPLPDGSNG